jgi:CubicO group peptidase (beta-lactamase class C family)
MRRRDFLALSSIAAARAVPVFGRAAQDGDRVDEIASVITAKMTEYHVPGVAFGIVKDGHVALRAFGTTNVDNPQPVTPDTVFPIASITKTVGATAIMRLVQEGKIAVDAPVRRYLPDFKVKDESAASAVTIAHLLSHTPGWEGQLTTIDRGTETLAGFVSGLADLPQMAPPGQVWSYNNAGFGVGGRVIEVVSGKGIHDALASLVFAPVGLTHAFTRTGTAMTYRFAVGHRQQKSGQTEVIRPFELPVNVTAGGGAMSIASLLQYARFHLSGKTDAGESLLSTKLLEQMRTPFVKKNATTDEMGLGWHLRRLGTVMTSVQGGTGAGHCLHVQLVPERNLAFGILTNHADGWRLVQDVERATLKAYEGLALAPNQATGGNRGVSEDMRGHAKLLATQPNPDAYVGKYDRSPTATYDVRAETGVLKAGPPAGPGVTVAFYGPDLAYAATDDGSGFAYVGVPIEFIRNASGAVGWIRVNGRIARKL